MLSPGRQSDLETYQRYHAKAKTVDERNRYADRINRLYKEGESRRVKDLRFQLIAAYRNKDSELAADISYEIWKESMTEKLRRR